MSVHSCYSADDWAKMTNCKVRVDGAWKQCKSIHANVDGAWKRVWPLVTVTVSSDPVNLPYDSTYYSSTSSSFYTHYYPQTLTLTVSGEDSAGYTLNSSNTVVICPVTTNDDGTVYYNTSMGCQYKYDSGSTWTNTGGFYPMSLGVGTHNLAVITSDMSSDTVKSSNFDADVVSNLGTITIYKQPLTITTSTLELEAGVTVGTLLDTLKNAGLVATASNFPDGWVVPSTWASGSNTCSTLELKMLDSSGNSTVGNVGLQFARGTIINATYGSDTTWGVNGISYNTPAKDTELPTGTYTLELTSYDAKGLDDFDITFISGTITVKEAAKFTDPFYPYFSSTGNQHTTGISINQPGIIDDLVIRKYTSSSSAGELFPAGTKFRLTQTGNGSGYSIFDLDAEGNIANTYVASGWYIDAFAADSAVLTAEDGGAYWWDGTKAVSSVTLTIN